ncbi:MAG: GntR family transcriptional regulator [Pseudomonadota bacterium]
MPYAIQRLPAAEFVYRQLRQRIASLELEPGTPAGEQTLAEQFGVSRTPVREACARLAREGLVDIYARRGVIVAPLRERAVSNARFVREALELAIVRGAAERADESGLFALDQIIDEQRWSLKRNDPERFFEADEKMHRHLCILAGREEVWFVIVDAKVHMDRARRLSLREQGIKKLLADHEAIVDAIKSRDADRAVDAMRQHLLDIDLQMDQIKARYPAYFEAGFAVSRKAG